MKNKIKVLLSIMALFTSLTNIAQNASKIYLYDIIKTESGYKLSNETPVNSTKGYNSQPHFYSDDILIFSSEREGQTDIAKYDVETGEFYFLYKTLVGGEYSPQRIPNSYHISAVRLDTTGLQRFYKYNIKTGKSTVIIKDLVVAYPSWYDKNTVVSSVIKGEKLDLVVSDLRKNTNTTVEENVGRSFHKVPNSYFVSFISKKEKKWTIKLLDLNNLTTKYLCETNGNHEDICWLPNGTLLQAKGNQIVILDPEKSKTWSPFTKLPGSISRITSNANGDKLAVVLAE